MQTQYPLATITTSVEGDLLAILSQVDAGFTTGQLRRMLDEQSAKSLPVIRAALERLTAQGVVTKHTESTAPIYRFNHDHLAAQHITALARLRALLLDRLAQTVAKWAVRPVYGALFGSAAIGRMRTDSDMDLLLIQPDGSDDEAWEAQVAELEAAVRRWTGNPCNVLSFAEAETREPGARRVLNDVADAGLTFAGQPSWLRRGLHSLRDER